MAFYFFLFLKSWGFWRGGVFKFEEFWVFWRGVAGHPVVCVLDFWYLSRTYFFATAKIALSYFININNHWKTKDQWKTMKKEKAKTNNRNKCPRLDPRQQLWHVKLVKTEKMENSIFSQKMTKNGMPSNFMQNMKKI